MRIRVVVGILAASGILAAEGRAQAATAVGDRPATVRVPGTTHLEALDLVQFDVRPVEPTGR